MALDRLEKLYDIHERVMQIDKAFDGATGWGSWMVELANERELLVNRARRLGSTMEHKHLARSASGGRVS